MAADARQPESPNFAFLAKHDGVLVRHAALAERYVLDDPNSALLKLRQFGELLARHTAAYAGIRIEERESQQQIIDRLWSMRVVDSQISQLFHGLRKAGNLAAHEHVDDRREALHQLQMSRKLAIWFHRSFGKEPGFKAGPFVPPPDPKDAERELQEELDRLRNVLVQVKAEASGAKADADEQRLAAEVAQQQAEVAWTDLEAALELAAETEQQLQSEREALLQRLAELQTEVVKQPTEQRETVLQTAQQEASQLELDETETRHLIDAQLREAGWEVDSQVMRHGRGTRPVKGRNMAIAEWPTANGPADYVLFVGLMPIAVVEAKRAAKNIPGSIQQAKRYSRGFNAEADHVSPGGPWGEYHVPFLFATNGRPYLRQIEEKSGVWFHDARVETNHPRALESWYTAEGLRQLLEQDIPSADQKLEAEPTDYLPLRDYQANAVRAVESEIASGKRAMLLAMATGTGKTITCIGLVYRLIKTKRFRRVLFLVDRSSLGEQASDKLKDVRLENLQTFTDIYDVKELGDLRPDTDTRLHIATVQGMVKRLLYPEDDTEPVPVDWYDCIVVDECHRGYNLDQEMSDNELQFRDEADYISKYRRVIDHFDAVKIGLTATPALHTTEIFGAPVFNYSYRQAVIDGWLVDHEPPYRLITALNEDGMKWEQGDEMKIYDTKSGQLQLFNVPDEVQVEVDKFNRKVITKPFNETVCQALAEHIDPDLPGKTLIFCVNDMHADMVVGLLKDAFDEQYGGVPDDAVMKITGAADKPLQLIRRFKNEQLPKVVVTVDLLTTGVDVPAISNIVFIRRIRSRILYDQMLGRGTRLCEDLNGPGEDKERFCIFDAVDIYSSLKSHTDMKPVVTRPNISFGQLAEELQTIDDESFRDDVKQQFLAKLQRKKLGETQLEQLGAACGFSREQLIEHVRNTEPAELGQWFADHPAVTDILDTIYRSGTQLIVSEHEDELRRVERGYGTAKKPEDYLDSFREFITTNADSIPALLVVTQRPRDLTRSQLRELRLTLDQEGFTETNLRTAWRETTNQDIAASIVGYVRHVALGQPLVSHRERVAAAMQEIMTSRSWTEPQRKWLQRIGKQLEQEVVVDREALDTGQFKAQGGFQRLDKIFKGQLDSILHDIADAMWQVAA